MLVRTGGRFGGYGGDGAKSWLLIKHRDDWAGELDIAEFAPRSVKSDGDFEDILAADNPDVWVATARPRAVRPARCSRNHQEGGGPESAAGDARSEGCEGAGQGQARGRAGVEDAAQDCRAIEAEDGSETALVS